MHLLNHFDTIVWMTDGKVIGHRPAIRPKKAPNG
jgi:hypothetical protein